MAGYHRKPSDEFNHLSPRELDVLRLVAMRLSNKQIASKLKLSLYTVKNHITSIFEKLGVNRRLDAASLVFDVEFDALKACDHCRVGAKAKVLAAEMRRLADDFAQ